MSTDRRALVLVAHADDESLGAGGTIPRLVAEGWAVEVVIVGDGMVTARGSVQDNRDGARRACAVLGVPAPRFVGYPDQKLDTVALSDMAGSVGALGIEPHLILTHAPTDLNRDHRLVSEVAKIVGRPKARPVSILGMEIPAVTFWNGAPFAADFFVDIGGTLETKLEALAQYENEGVPFPHPCSGDGVRLLARYHGMQCGVAAAEAFTVIRAHAGLLPGSGVG